ncbi:hypothetical protein Cni_G07229 [Canna indica]|uniref:JAB1/MPN/MOV34 metalloenzyme domain-containing protein n=1 Tax=Canna indica TaxID=4628 RepID=A0AAQ3JYL6_9LILI|nr:hypothetical protein Cni_G07229 [Canna indica]
MDGRFPVSFYFRIADLLLKQAEVYREEGNLECLDLILGRYIRLVSEAIPQHPNYSNHSSKEKLHHDRILQESTKEIKKLKPLVSMNSDVTGQHGRSKHRVDGFRSASQRWTKKILSFPSFKEGNSRKAVYLMDNPSLIMIDVVDGCSSRRICQSSDNEVHVVKHYLPSPVVSWVEDGSFVERISHVIFPKPNSEGLVPSYGESSTSSSTQDVHISVKLTEEFLDLAKENTQNDLETCGILGALLKDHTFYITTLIIPKQESSSNSCQALNEEEIHAVLDENSLYPAGWIHTHPSQTCFLSSIDLHTQYSYQVMLPEAIAIVMAPTDPGRTCGIFRLTDPGGITILKQCKERGFHPHPGTSDGNPIYEICSNIYTNANLRFEIIDLRSS